MVQSLPLRSFASGELAPAYGMRADLAQYQAALKTCRNCIVQRPGGVANRAGFRYVAAAKTTSANVRLLRYVSETDGQSVLIEAGSGYLRFFLNGAPVRVTGVAAWSAIANYVQGDVIVSAGVNYYAIAPSLNQVPPNATYWYPLTADLYEIPTPFTGANLPNWDQNGAVICLTHRLVHPQDLLFFAIDRWILQPIVTVPQVSAPVINGYTAFAGAGARTFKYVVTAAAPDTYEESLPSAPNGAAAKAPPTAVSPNQLDFNPGVTVNGDPCPQYYVYCDPYGNGIYGFIGTTTDATALFNDIGLTPDFTLTPPVPRDLFNAAGSYPHVSCFHQQRRFFGQTVDAPAQIEGSRVGLPSNFGISAPIQDDDALSFKVAGKQRSVCRHLLSVQDLIVLASDGEWRISAGKDVPLAPNQLAANQELYVGASETRPVIIGNSILYVQAHGAKVCDVRYDQAIEGLGGRDLTLFATHLFQGRTIVGLDYQQTPDSVAWAIRDDGTLLGLTYLRELNQWGWHRHDTGASGAFEQVVVVPEETGDTVYVIVKRTINGATVRYLERLEGRAMPDPADSLVEYHRAVFFVDCGLSYEGGAPITVVTGLGHLEGEVLAVVADGVVLYDGDPGGAQAANFTVVGGQITLAAAAVTVIAGLPYIADLETVDLDVAGASVRDKKKRVASVTLLLEASARTFQAGPDADTLTAYDPATFEDPTNPAWTGLAQIDLTSEFGDHGRVFIRHSQPLPLTVLGVIPSVELGG